MNRYVVLLRGINVGGKNIIKMSDLKACLEQAGFADVSTYIASGNVFVSSAEKAPAITARVEKLLAKTFDYDATVVVRSAAQMQATIAEAPPGFGRQPAKYRYDCLFLKEPLKAAVALKSVPAKEGVDTVHAGPGALYFSRLVARITQTQLTKIVGMPLYKQLTIRNWNTTTKLAALVAK